jgi:AcrR family transcriptional regulator
MMPRPVKTRAGGNRPTSWSIVLRAMAANATRRRRGRPRAGQAGPGETRAALVAAAASVFAERGYRAASVDAVVAAAGLSKGTFYWHFKSKDDLLFALLEERIDRPLREWIEHLESAPADTDLAPEASRWFIDLLQRERDALLLEQEYWALAARDKKLRARYARRQARLRAALAKALEARHSQLGAPPFSTPAEEVATAYLALANGLALERLIDADAVPDHLLGETTALVYGGLVARAEARRG